MVCEKTAARTGTPLFHSLGKNRSYGQKPGRTGLPDPDLTARMFLMPGNPSTFEQGARPARGKGPSEIELTKLQKPRNRAEGSKKKIGIKNKIMAADQ